MPDKPIKHAFMRTALAIHRPFYERSRFRIMRGWWPNLASPETVNEYVLNRKLNDIYVAPQLSGTLEGYERAQELVPEMKVPPLAACVGEEAQMEAVWALPDGDYILKGSHGSGMIRRLELPRDRDETIKAEITAQVGRWLKNQFSKTCGETCYDAAKPVILVEELLGDNGQLSADIKIHCHNDRPHVVQFIDRHKGYLERFTWIVENDGSLTQTKLYKGELDEAPEHVVAMLVRAVAHTRQLCQGLGYVRVDFLVDGDDYFFGEFTFIPAGGCMPLIDKDADRRFFALINRTKAEETIAATA